MKRDAPNNEFINELEELIEKELQEPVQGLEIQQIISATTYVIDKRLSKVESFDVSSNRKILDAVGALLSNKGVDFRQGLRVFDEVEKQIIESHETNAGVNENGEPNHSATGEQAERVEFILPIHIKEFLKELDITRWVWLQDRIIADLQLNSLADKKADLASQLSIEIQFGELADERVLVVLTELLRITTGQTAIEADRLFTKSKLGLADDLDEDAKNEFDPAKRGLTRQLALMLFDELFPNLNDTKPGPKGEFLSLLVGWNAKGLSNKWGDYNINSKEYEDDLETVAKWKRKLKLKH